MSEDAMDIVGYSAARQRLAQLMDEAVEGGRPIVVTRRKGKSVVMLSLEEYEAMAETLHLLRSPKNAQRLMRAIKAADAGKLRPSPRGRPR